jgi:hypothetical protein
MPIKKEYLILVAIIIGLSLYLFLRNPDRALYQLPQLPPVDQKTISKIEISKAGGSIVLKKKDEQWYIAPEEYLADKDTVSNMLDTIEDMTLTAMVSESKSYERYDLVDDKRITVRAWTGENRKRDFGVGKPASSFRHTFVKLAGDDRVYHARNNFRRKFEQTTESLRDKTVLSFRKEDIQQIRITKAKEDFLLSRTSSSTEASTEEESNADKPSAQKEEALWQSADGNKADKAEIDRLISTLSNLRCKTYMDDTKKEGLSNPIFSIALKGVEEHRLSVFEKKDKEAQIYPAVSSANDYPFFLDQRQADKIIKMPDGLFKELKQQG